MNKLLTILLLLFCGGLASAQTDIFVSAAQADDSGDGSSWATAKKTVAAGIAAAGTNGTVYVMVGEYAVDAELTVPSGVTVTGGYSSSSTGTDLSQRRSPGINYTWGDPTQCTILSGNSTHRMATVLGTLEGCVVRYGHSSGNGGGVLIDGGTVSHCVLTNCTAHSNENGTEAKGGGAYITNDGSLLNCVVCYNRADNGYGVAGMSGNAINNTIVQNYATNCGTLTDYDDNEYQTVMIGSQCWMRENLRVTHYADGTAVAAGEQTSSTTAYYYNPGTSASETETFGLLYNLRAARRASHDTYTDNNPSGMQGICPAGWHLPSNAEFEQMVNFLAHDAQNLCQNTTANVGKSLASTQNWQTSDAGCAVGNILADNNFSLFSAQPAGYYDGAFQSLYAECRFWTASRNGSSNSQCVYRGLTNDNATLLYNYLTQEKGCSVRCVKN
ncbi:MAG: fibrobacter succinogenes major paralogous domain-containing protein [Bacteroidales bacterium]|nr:fibrobacter succinogenes major paralogous domain-containing protein [Bacteroidales bacterium]